MGRMIGAAPAGAKMVVVGRGFISITRPPYQTGRGGRGGVGPIWCPNFAQDRQTDSHIDSQTVRQAGRKVEFLPANPFTLNCHLCCSVKGL